MSLVIAFALPIILMYLDILTTYLLKALGISIRGNYVLQISTSHFLFKMSARTSHMIQQNIKST